MVKNMLLFVMIPQKDGDDETDIPLNKHPNEVDENKLEEGGKGESEADDVVDVQGSGVTHLHIVWSPPSSSSSWSSQSSLLPS